MSEMERFIERGGNLDKLGYCAHELGHAITDLAAGIKPVKVELRVGWLGGVSGGCWLPKNKKIKDIRLYMTSWMAGQAGEARFLHVYRGMPKSKALRVAGEAAKGDYDLFDEDCKRWGLSYSKSSLLGDAWSLVMSRGSRIDRGTVALYKKGRLSGSSL